MTEKEKMINGMMYDANCEELVQDRIDAKEKCYDYNNFVRLRLKRELNR